MAPRLTIALLLLASVALAADVPSTLEAPGVINRDVTQANIHRTICVPGWTKTIRPPASYTNKLKAAQLPPGSDLSAFEEDHLISLEIGGHPRDPKNLWPQPYAGQWGARVKDRLETELHRRVCKGSMTLEAAQTCIRTDWIACYRKVIGEAGAMR